MVRIGDYFRGARKEAHNLGWVLREHWQNTFRKRGERLGDHGFCFRLQGAEMSPDGPYNSEMRKTNGKIVALF